MRSPLLQRVTTVLYLAWNRKFELVSARGGVCHRYLSWLNKNVCDRNCTVSSKCVTSSTRIRQLGTELIQQSVQNGLEMLTDFEARICWVDMEMTGLDPSKDTIMELSCVITDKHLNEVAKIEQIIIHQPEYVLNAMGDWCKEHHGASGLTEACLKSKISLKEAEDTFLEFLKKHTAFQKAPLAGNSVHADRQFIRQYMPKVYKYLHYRIIDVSTLSELCK
ncbi:oligoribonuclease, partial [Tropilaelaps mercedesae]